MTNKLKGVTGLCIKVPLEESLNELVRDLTKVGSIPKSQARDRIMGLIRTELASQIEEIRGKLEGKKKICKHKGMPYSVERECHERQIKGYNEGINAALSILQEMGGDD